MTYYSKKGVSKNLSKMAKLNRVYQLKTKTKKIEKIKR